MYSYVWMIYNQNGQFQFLTTVTDLRESVSFHFPATVADFLALSLVAPELPPEVVLTATIGADVFADFFFVLFSPFLIRTSTSPLTAPTSPLTAPEVGGGAAEGTIVTMLS